MQKDAWPSPSRSSARSAAIGGRCSILLFVPALFLLLYGYALNFDIRNVRLAVEDRDRTPAEPRAGLGVHQLRLLRFRRRRHCRRARSSGSSIATRSRAALVIPARLRPRRRRRAGRSTVQVIIDGDNSNTATTVDGLCAIDRRGGRRRRMAAADRASTPPVALEPRVWYNPQLRSTLFLVPGLIAYISMITAVISTALSIVREKERGTMEQVRMAPVEPGGLRPRQDDSVSGAVVRLGAADHPGRDGAVRSADARLVAHARARRSRCSSSARRRKACVISSVAPNQQVAFQLALLSSFLPTFILSGLHLPDFEHAEAIQSITYVDPGALLSSSRCGRSCSKAPMLAAFWTDLVALGIFRDASCWRSASVAAEAGVERSARECHARVLHLMRKELLELRQDPRLFGIVIVAPILQLTRPRLRRDDRRQGRADGGRRCRSIGGEPRADRPIRRLGQLHASSAWSARPTRSIAGWSAAMPGWR